MRVCWFSTVNCKIFKGHATRLIFVNYVNFVLSCVKILAYVRYQFSLLQVACVLVGAVRSLNYQELSLSGLLTHFKMYHITTEEIFRH